MGRNVIMAQRHLPAAQQVQVAERVTFRYGRRTVAGHVASKGRSYAYIVTDDGHECRVPYHLLSRALEAPRQLVQSRTDTVRARFQAGDRVGFTVGTDVLHGTISRMNPTYAHVVCDDDREYRVLYARLSLQRGSAETALRGHQRTDGDLQAIAARATAWIVAHQLAGWSFQFDHATKRAGCCNYQMRGISLAYAYARVATDEAIDDTLLHEIAHALVGKAHGHDQVWPHSTELCGGAPTPFVIPLQLCSLTPILGHQLRRPSDLRVTYAQYHSTDPRKPHHHRRFSQRSHLCTAAWRWQGVCRMRRGFPPLPRLSARPQGDL